MSLIADLRPELAARARLVHPTAPLDVQVEGRGGRSSRPRRSRGSSRPGKLAILSTCVHTSVLGSINSIPKKSASYIGPFTARPAIYLIVHSS